VYLQLQFLCYQNLIFGSESWHPLAQSSPHGFRYLWCSPRWSENKTN